MNNIVFVLLRRLHSPLIALIIVYAVSVLGFVLIPGMNDQGQPYRMDFFHAFYFVSFMGTTIGFGEIPFPFTAAQRMWAVISIYATVIAWLYAIGSMLAALQHSAFRELLTSNAFRRSIQRIREPFYLVCGYGDTGSMLIKALTEADKQVVVVEIDQERINALELEDLKLFVPGLCADASDPDILIKAGLTLPHCVGVVALTNDDAVNLKIAITSKLLNPSQLTIARSETHDAEANIASFGTDHIINPFDTFAGRLAMALHSPGTYLLHEWMASVPHEPLTEPLFPPTGKWVLCGYGRFGKAVHIRLRKENVDITIIEAKPEITEAPSNVIIGRGTEAVTLQEAGIEDAVGVVAGTDDDGNNLSILMTARELNPDLFMVARQNSRHNDAIFQAANLDLIMQRGSIIGHKIFALIQSPMLDLFLRLARQQENEWANELVSRISGVTATEAPVTWELDITEQNAPAMFAAARSRDRVQLWQLYRHPRNREETLACIPLLCKRGDRNILLPDDDTKIFPGDSLLFCGQARAQHMMEWLAGNRNVFNYIQTGEEHPSGYLWRLMTRKTGKARH
jgi:voltage-gated potassium channel